MRAKLGLAREEEGDDQLIGELLALMAKTRADYTLTFRGLTETGEAWLFLFGAGARRSAGMARRYRARMAGEGDRTAAMNAVNPKYVLRNWVAETAIRAVEDQGDSATAGPHPDAWCRAPMTSMPGEEALAEPPPPEFCGLSVSCSS